MEFMGSKQASEILGVDQDTISRWCRERRKNSERRARWQGESVEDTCQFHKRSITSEEREMKWNICLTR